MISMAPVAPGERAPNFMLPAVAGTDTVSLADYRGRSPLFLALMLGLWCPFCRRQLVQLGGFGEKLKALGIDSLAVVATAPENARLYFRFRPTKLRLASDPELTTHRAFRVPKPEATPEVLQAMDTVRINPTGELPEPLPISQAGKVLQQMDGYVYTPADQGDIERQWPQLKALYLIDRDGIVRWADIECASEGLAGIGKFPSEEVILRAARELEH
jgi:peroxiredoxin